MELRQYQKDGVDKLCNLLQRRHPVLLADPMGAGKTAQGFSVAPKIGAYTILYICPASLRLNTANEAAIWLPDYDVEIVMSKAFFNKPRSICKKRILIISYELAAKYVPMISGNSRWDLIIFDEAHYLKNRQSNRTKACFGPIWASGYDKLLMTGTPCPNGLMCGWSLFNKLEPSEFPSKYKYGARYCNVKKNWFTGFNEYTGYRKERMPELREKLSKFMVRRRKKDILSELPDKTFTTFSLSIGRAEDYRLSEREIQDAFKAICSEHVATIRRGVGMLKVQQVAEIVANIMVEKNRLVVWTYHQDVSDNTVKALESVDCEPLQITGKTPMKKRHDIVERFQSDSPEKLCLVAQQEAAGVGINLHRADTCLFLEMSWVPAAVAQAIDRLHRLGQKNAVQIIYLIARGTLDEQIIGSLQQKIKAITGAIQ